MTDEVNTDTGGNPVSFYIFSFESKTEGLIASKLPDEETKEKVLAELKASIGDDFKLLEFRLATEEEVAEAMFQMGALDDTEVDSPLDEVPPTLN